MIPRSLRLLEGTLAICRLQPTEEPPAWAWQGGFVSVTRTSAELSVVCPEASVPEGVHREGGWRCLAVEGPLDFAEVGVLAALVGPLAEAGVSVFAVSTYDTDYLAVREAQVGWAIEVLRRAGHEVV